MDAPVITRLVWRGALSPDTKLEVNGVDVTKMVQRIDLVLEAGEVGEMVLTCNAPDEIDLLAECHIRDADDDEMNESRADLRGDAGRLGSRMD